MLKFYGVLSDERAKKSRSPQMFNGLFHQWKEHAAYVPFMVDPSNIGAAVNGLRALNAAGCNVTVPYKAAVIEFLDEISDDARDVNAVNTIVPASDGRLIGQNTDIDGFLAALESLNCTVQGKDVLLIGTGGAARAILAALRKVGAKTTLAGRRPDATVELAKTFGAAPMAIADLDKTPQNAYLVVNASSVSAPEEAPEMTELLEKCSFPALQQVVDINYGRPVNFWQQLAERHSTPFSDGLPMLAAQAWIAYKYWSGTEKPLADFVAALKN